MPKLSSFRLSHHPHGFTLIELLVVLIVMGVAMGMVMLQLMPDKNAALREEAGRLSLLLENAGLEARASGRSLAWSGEGSRYRFLAKNEYGDWVRIDDESVFRPRILPEGVNVGGISVEGQALKEGEFVLLSANTFAVPYSIRLNSAYGHGMVTGKSTGDVGFTVEEFQLDNVKP